MSTTAIRVVAPVPPEVTALANACQALAQDSALDRFEIAVKSRMERGINDDGELRIADDLLHQVVLGGDALEAAVKPVISDANARHKLLIATAKPWQSRWTTMADGLKSLIIMYKRHQEELIRRQNQELERAANAERLRLDKEAKAALRNGDMEAAQDAMDAVNQVVTPVIAQATPVLDNSSTRKPWQVEVTDAEALVKAIAAGIVPLSAIREFDLGFLKREATKRGGLPKTWSGLRSWQEERLSVKR
jgi:hypothetical protein